MEIIDIIEASESPQDLLPNGSGFDEAWIYLMRANKRTKGPEARRSFFKCLQGFLKKLEQA